jgi:hypothetical protein
VLQLTDAGTERTECGLARRAAAPGQGGAAIVPDIRPR